MIKPKKVFVSYSHDSQEHKDWVAEFTEQLRCSGIDAIIDRYVIPDIPWPQWMQQQIIDSDITLLVCTEEYKERFEGGSNSKGVTWEGMLSNQILYDERCRNKKFIAIVRSIEQRVHIPLPYRPFNYYVVYDHFDALVKHINGNPDLETPPLLNDSLRKELNTGMPSSPPQLEKKLDGEVNREAYIEANVYSPITGVVSTSAVISSKYFYEGDVWDTKYFSMRPLLTNGEVVEKYQSFTMVIEECTREPILLTARCELLVQLSLQHGERVKANDIIGKAFIPKDNVQHPPFGPTRGQTIGGVIRYSPVINSSAWAVKKNDLNRKIRIISSELEEKSGITSLNAVSAGSFRHLKKCVLGLKVQEGEKVGMIYDGVKFRSLKSPVSGVFLGYDVKDHMAVYQGKPVATLKTDLSIIFLMLAPLRSAQHGWLELVSPLEGKIEINPNLNPGDLISDNTFIASVTTSNAQVNLKFDVLEAEIMSIFKCSRSTVEFGEPIVLVRLTKANIRSPMVGNFYRALMPGGKPFVDIGSEVRKDDTVCIIEALKMENRLVTEYDCIIENINIRDGDKVDWDEVIFQTKLIW